MRKQDLIREVAKSSNLPESKVSDIVSAVFHTIQSSLADGDEVAISGFGTFRTMLRPAREGRNPQSGELMQIGARRSPAFRPGAALKRAVEVEP